MACVLVAGAFLAPFEELHWRQHRMQNLRVAVLVPVPQRCIFASVFAAQQFCCCCCCCCCHGLLQRARASVLVLRETFSLLAKSIGRVGGPAAVAELKEQFACLDIKR
jgi:hypothetical protein